MSLHRMPPGRRSTGDHRDLSSSRRLERRQLDDHSRIQINENPPTGSTASPVGHEASYNIKRTYAVVREKYIYAVADVRGSGFQGYEFESDLYNNIGNPEVEDLLEVVHWLLEKLPYIDSKNVFVQGEQYGGMVAVLMALKEPNLFKAVAAYHPPLFWISTTAFFAERLLRRPTLKDNYYGYAAKSIGMHVYRYRDMKILIVMDSSTNSGGHSQQLSMLRDNMNAEPYRFNFMNVIELRYGTEFERGRHQIAYYHLMFDYFRKFNGKKDNF